MSSYLYKCQTQMTKENTMTFSFKHVKTVTGRDELKLKVTPKK